MTLVKAWDQGTWNKYELHEDGTFNGVYGPPIHHMDNRYLWALRVPVAEKPFNGAPILLFEGRRYIAASGPNVFD
jgi:hypothetical protein